MEKSYSQMTIERLESSIVNHTKSLEHLKKPSIKKTFDKDVYTKKLYMAEWRLLTAKRWLQKRTDQRDMKNH